MNTYVASSRHQARYTITGMSEDDVALRNLTYKLFVELGRAPTVEDTALSIGCTPDEVWAGWQRLHSGHALVLQAGTREIRMANPFSAGPTAYRVFADNRWWFANCAWDAFGIGAALHADSHIESSCADCGEPLRIEVRNAEPDDDSLVFHCLVPAMRWWDDIAFT